MALQKVPVNINFAQGLDEKSDPFQLPIGKFAALHNRIFDKTGRLTKRNGFGSLTSLPSATYKYLSTFNGNLTAIGASVAAYSESTDSWVQKGNYQPIQMSVLPTVRSALSQVQCDSVTALNGLVCTVYTETTGVTTHYKYIIADSVTGQNIVAATNIPSGSGTVSGSPRVFFLGAYFIIVYTNTIVSTPHLQYIAISSTNVSSISSPADIAASYTPSSGVSWDGIVVDNQLYISYNSAVGGQHVAFTYLTTAFVVASPASFAGSVATLMSVTSDISNPLSPVIYASFWDSAGNTGHSVAVNVSLDKVMNAVQWLGSGTVTNVASVAQNGIVTVFYENGNNYSYDSSIPTHFVSKNSITFSTSTAGSPSVVLRSVGLASKAFLMNGTEYVLAEYSSVFQPTYFLINSAGNALAKFAYENGGGYLTLGLPTAQIISSSLVQIPYLYKDLISSVNKEQGLVSAAGVYAQTGVNLASISFDASTLATAEIGSNLNISGGYLYSYDGNTLSEQNFHLWPDNVEAVAQADIAVTADTSSITTPTILTNVSDVTGIIPGMLITGTGVPVGTTVVSVGTTTVTMSASATISDTAVDITFGGNQSDQQYFYQVIYQQTDAQGNIFNSAPSIPTTATTTAGNTYIVIQGPMARITGKSNVKIVIYRWSAAQEEYFQLTSISVPLLNDTTTDSWSYTDVLSDAQILGNGLIYTNGGVLEDVGTSACSALTLFDTRLWAISAEDPNLLLYSKQIIEGTPVEMSDLLTFYVAPNSGATAATGPMKCIFPMDDKLILFKKDALYYINGSGPDNTGANSQYSQPIFITSTVGSVNQNSIVFIPKGLMFQSDKGIWLLGRDLSTTYIGAEVENSNDQVVTSAVAIPETTQVRFTLDNDTFLMYDYFYEQWGDFLGLTAASSTIFQDLHTYVSPTGAVSQETPGVYMDNGNPVLTSFTTGWLNLAGIQGYQRAYALFILGQYLSPHLLEVGIAYNYNSSTYQLTTINPTNFSSAAPSPFGDVPAPFGSDDNIESWRVFLARQRCSSFQITINEVYDPSFGLPPGEGLTLSSLLAVVAIKKGWRTQSAAHTAGSGVNRG